MGRVEEEASPKNSLVEEEEGIDNNINFNDDAELRANDDDDEKSQDMGISSTDTSTLTELDTSTELVRIVVPPAHVPSGAFVETGEEAQHKLDEESACTFSGITQQKNSPAESQGSINSAEDRQEAYSSIGLTRTEAPVHSGAFVVAEGDDNLDEENALPREAVHTAQAESEDVGSEGRETNDALATTVPPVASGALDENNKREERAGPTAESEEDVRSEGREDDTHADLGAKDDTEGVRGGDASQSADGRGGESSSRLTPFERFLRTQAQSTATTTTNSGGGVQENKGANDVHVTTEEETRSSLTQDAVDSTSTELETRQPPPAAPDQAVDEKAKYRAPTTATATTRGRRGAVAEGVVTPTPGGVNTSTTSTRNLLSRDAQAKERARVGGTGATGVSRPGVVSVSSRTISSQDACRTSSEEVLHEVQPLPSGANTATAQLSASTSNEPNNNTMTTNGTAALEELLDDVQPLPSSQPAPNGATPPAPSNPGAHSVNQPGAVPVPVQAIRYSIFGRLSDNSGPLQLPPLPTYSTSDEASTRRLNRVSSSDLVVADMVNGSSKLLYQHARVIEEIGSADQQERIKNRRIGIACCGAMLFIIVTIVFAVLVVNNKKNNSETSSGEARSPTVAPTTWMTPNETVWPLLPQYTKETINRDADSAQYKAYQWLLEDPNLRSYPDWRIKQRLALAILFHSTNGNRWWNNTNWLSYEVHECHWSSTTVATDWFDQLAEEYLDFALFEGYLLTDICEGFDKHRTTSADNDRVGEYMHLRLFKNNLQGTVPLELYWLTRLRTIHLSTSDLQGTLSSHVGQLTNLDVLDMVRTKTTGTLPTQIGLLTNLRAFGFHTNGLEGSIPSEIGLMEGLVGFYFEENNLTSTLPTEMGMLRNLSFVSLDVNSLVGPLPSELGRLDKLTDLQLSFNDITGTIPTEFGQMTTLLYLNVSENWLRGSIPTEVLSMENLKYLSLGKNHLNGSLPEDIGISTNLKELDLGENDLTGSIPEAIYKLDNLHHLFLHANYFNGTLSTDVGLLSRLEKLHLDHNYLQGSIPTEIGRLSQLVEVELSVNLFTGTVPTQMGLLSNLTLFRADTNSLTGDIPSELGMLLHMMQMNISFNDLRGAVPVQLGNLPARGSLRYLNVSSNQQLSGVMPAGLCGRVSHESKYYGECSEMECGFYMECTATLCGCDCLCPPSTTGAVVGETNSTTTSGASLDCCIDLPPDGPVQPGEVVCPSGECCRVCTSPPFPGPDAQHPIPTPTTAPVAMPLP